MTLSIVIPCLNERKTILAVLKDAQENAKVILGKSFEIIVADNGSTDGSKNIIKKFGLAKVVDVSVKGYGAALHYGIQKTKGKYVIFADADGSYPFSNLSLFMKIIKKNPDMVLGTRLGGKIEKGAMPFLNRYFGTPILTYLIKILYKINTTDCNSGMRMIKKSFYETLNMRNSGMEWASELLLKTAIKNGKYLEVPILFKKDLRSKAPHLSRWSDGWRHLKAIVLLKPRALLFATLVLFVFSIFVYSINFALTILFITISFVLTLSYLTLMLLKFVIDKKASLISRFLVSFSIVPYVVILLLILFLTIFFLPDSRMGTKLFLSGIMGIVSIWIFFIETIKTHLINRLENL